MISAMAITGVGRDTAFESSSKDCCTVAAAAVNVTTVKELSEILLSNRAIHLASMKDSRDEFQASLPVGNKTEEEKQAERNFFRINRERKHRAFKDGQIEHRRAFFSKIESKEEKKAARTALQYLMMEEKKNENAKMMITVNPNLASKVKELSEILLSNRKTHRASMNDSRSSFQAFLVGKKPEEKKKERKIFRVSQQEKRQSFRKMQKEHRQSLFSNLESQEEKKAARAALKSLMMGSNDNNGDDTKVPRRNEGSGGSVLMMKGPPIKAARKAFRTSLVGLSPIKQQQKRKAFRTEMKKVRQESFRSMNAERRKALEALNHSLEGLTLAERRIKREKFRKEEQERQLEFREKLAKAFKDAQENMEFLTTMTMVAKEKKEQVEKSTTNTAMKVDNFSDDAIAERPMISNEVSGLMLRSRNNNFRRNLFLAFVENGGQNDETMKKKWHSTKVATRDGIVKNVAAFEASLVGLSFEDQRFNWNARLAECRARFMSATQKINDCSSGGTSSSTSFSLEDALAARAARMALTHFRRAKRNAMMTFKKNTGSVAASPSSPFRMNNYQLKKEFETELDKDGFTKDLDEFISSLKGLAKKEQNIHWKNRIQNLQREARKARAIVVLTREAAAAARQSCEATKAIEIDEEEGNAGVERLVNEDDHKVNEEEQPFVSTDVICTAAGDCIIAPKGSVTDDYFDDDMVIVDGNPEEDATESCNAIHENNTNDDEDEDFVLLDA